VAQQHFWQTRCNTQNKYQDWVGFENFRYSACSKALLKACFQATSLAHLGREDSLAGAELVARSIVDEWSSLASGNE
jgi:hypothetical protein